MKIFVFCIGLACSGIAGAVPYQQLPALQKRLILWNGIKASAYSQLPPVNTGLGISQILATLSTLTDLSTTFDRTSDQFPAGRQKVIHPFGTVAAIRWIPLQGHPYSGIFQSGAYGLARLSLAGDPGLLGNIPGMALKLFVDGSPSLNLQVMYSLDGQGNDQNFFAHPFTNDLPAPSSFLLKSLAALFSLVQDPPTYLAVDHLAKLDRFGRRPLSAVSPYALIFVPTDQIKNRFVSPGQHDFRTDLNSLQPGSALYTIWAKSNSVNSQLLPVGQLVLESRFVASQLGDQQLFFQHHRTKN